MKKLITCLVAILSFSVLYAQGNKRNQQHCDHDRNASYDNRRYDERDVSYRPAHGVEKRQQHDAYARNDRYNDRDRRAEIDRVNRDYDRRIKDYQNDRRITNLEREREVERLKKERNAKLKNFAGGAIVGGVLGVLIGTQL